MAMVGIVFSISFYWCYIHGSRMFKTHIKRDSRTLFVVTIIQRGGWGVKDSKSNFSK